MYWILQSTYKFTDVFIKRITKPMWRKICGVNGFLSDVPAKPANVIVYYTDMKHSFKYHQISDYLLQFFLVDEAVSILVEQSESGSQLLLFLFQRFPVLGNNFTEFQKLQLSVVVRCRRETRNSNVPSQWKQRKYIYYWSLVQLRKFIYYSEN